MTRMRGARSDVTGGELDFSESERVYGRGQGYGRLDRTLDSDRRDGGNVETVGTVNINRLRSDRYRGRYRTQQGAAMGHRDQRGTRVDSYRAGGRVTIPQRNYTSERRPVDRNPDGRVIEHRTVSRSPDRRHVSPSPERYYVRETKESQHRETEDKEVETCCCGCVEIVDSVYCCKGVKLLRCTCLDSDDEEKAEEKPEIQKQYVFYRTHDRNSDYSDSYTDETESDTYDEIDTKRLVPRPQSATYEKRVDAREYGHGTREYANVTRSARLMSRPRSAEHARYVRKVPPTQSQIHHDRALPPVAPPRPPERASHVSRKPPAAPTQKPAQRHVGVQMTTKYVVAEPKRKLVRNVGCQTVCVPSPPSARSSSSSSSRSTTPRRVHSPNPSPVPSPEPSPVPNQVSSPIPSPISSPVPHIRSSVISPPPSIRAETPPPEVEPYLTSYEPAPIRGYKTAIINILEPDSDPQEEVLVRAPPRAPVPRPARPLSQPPPAPPPVIYRIDKPEPIMEPGSNPSVDPMYISLAVSSLPVDGVPSPVISRVTKLDPKQEPEANDPVNPIYYSLPSEPKPKRHRSRRRSPPPVVYRIVKPEQQPEPETNSHRETNTVPEDNSVSELSHDPLPVKSHPDRSSRKKVFSNIRFSLLHI